MISFMSNTNSRSFLLLYASPTTKPACKIDMTVTLMLNLLLEHTKNNKTRAPIELQTGRGAGGWTCRQAGRHARTHETIP